MTMATRTARRPRSALVFLAAVLAAAVGLITAGPASALTASAAQNAVGASSLAVQVSLGPSTDIIAGQRLGNSPVRPGIVVATGVAANSADDAAEELVQLYRNVDADEFDSIATTGQWGTGAGMEGKWFATQGEHAGQWGVLLNRGQGLTVTTRIPRSIADQLHFHAGKLDGVGPGFYSDADQLAQINKYMTGIELWPK